MTETQPADFVAVAVAKTGGAPLRAMLSEALRAAGLAAGGPRALGIAGDLEAVEIATRLAPLEHRAAQAALAGRLAARADVALLPQAGRQKRVLVCDMDSTIIGQECVDELADFAGLKAEVAEITERAMRGELDFEAALTTRVAMLKGLELSVLQRCFDERVTLTPGAKTLVETMNAQGARTLLVSGGFTFFTARVAAAAGFQGHRANRLLDDGRALTGKVAQPILGREAKRAALEEAAAEAGVDAGATLAIGDGANDLAMIKAAGLGLAYRAKPIVAAEADAAITLTDLRAALFFQGYRAEDFAG